MAFVIETKETDINITNVNKTERNNRKCEFNSRVYKSVKSVPLNTHKYSIC